MVRGRNFDHAVSGRLATYFGNWSGPEALNHGHYHYYAAFTAFSMAFPDFHGCGFSPDTVGVGVGPRTPLAVGFGAWLDTPFTRSLPRGGQLAAWRRTLTLANATGGADELAGYRVFYDSDYAVHRRPGFSLTVKMASARTFKSECVNEEGKQGRNMADGVTTAFVTGAEFEDIFPVWDWRAVPGTVEVVPPNASDWSCSQTAGVGRGNFAGGATDGANGLASFDYYSDGGLHLHRSWFFFGQHALVMATGTSGGPGSGGTSGNVTVSLDQRLLHGPVFVSAGAGANVGAGSPRPVPAGAWQALPRNGWVYHGGVAYSWQGAAARAFVGNRTGAWSRITQTDDVTTVTKPVFAAQLDLGRSSGAAPRDVHYEYGIHPAAGPDAAGAAAAVAEASAAQLASANSYDVQCVCFSGANAAEEGTGTGANAAVNVTSMAALFYVNRTARLPAAGCVDMTVLEAPGSRGLVAVATTADAEATAAMAGERRLVLHLADPHLGSGPATLAVTGAWVGTACTPLNGTHSLVRVTLPKGAQAGSSASVECRGHA